MPTVVIRLSELDVKVISPIATATGLSLDALLTAASLKFLAVDTDFRKNAGVGPGLSWGPPPPRFASAELVEVELNEAQHETLDKATGRVHFKRSGASLELSLAQFMVGATLRLIQRRKTAGPSALKAELLPMLGARPPSLSLLDRPAVVAEPEEQESDADVPPERVKPASDDDGPSRSVIVSMSSLGLAPVAALQGEPERGEDDDPAESKTRPMPGLRLAPRPAASVVPPSPARPSEREDADGAPEREGRRGQSRALPKQAPKSPKPTLQPKWMAAIGGAVIVTVIVSAGVVRSSGSPSASVETLAVVPSGSADQTRPEESLPGTLRPRNPKPSDVVAVATAPETSTALSPEQQRVQEQLEKLAKGFHESKSDPPKDIDAMLKKRYGRIKVRPDGEVDHQLPPEQRFDSLILKAVRAVTEYPVPPALVKAVIRRESNFDPHARSGTGAIGLMQIMPFNADRLTMTVKDLDDPEHNILAGTRLLGTLLHYYDGDVVSALVGYNATPQQPGARLPMNGETRLYVVAVLQYFTEYESEFRSTR